MMKRIDEIGVGNKYKTEWGDVWEVVGPNRYDKTRVYVKNENGTISMPGNNKREVIETPKPTTLADFKPGDWVRLTGKFMVTTFGIVSEQGYTIYPNDETPVERAV